MKAGRASATARLIAAATLLHGGRGGRDDAVPAAALPLCRALLSGPGVDRLLRASAEWPPTQAAWRALERATHPGIVRHYAQRKRVIEQRCRTALAQGFTRVVVVGAGFDTLALRLAAAFPNVEWVEIDHPSTQAAKLQALTGSGIATPPNLRFAAADLAGGPWPAALARDGRATFVVLEGVLMYLPPPRVWSLLAHTVPALASRVRALFSYMVRWPDGRPGFRPTSRAVDAWLRWRGEPFAWFADPAQLEDTLRALAFDITAHLHAPLGGPGLRGENLVEIERGPGGAPTALRPAHARGICSIPGPYSMTAELRNGTRHASR